MMRNVRLPGAPRLTPQFLFWAGMAAFGCGFVYHRMWHAVSLGSSQLVWLLLIAALVAGLLHWFARRRLARSSMATTWLLVGLVAWMCFAGVAQCLATVLIGLAALGAGSLLVPAGGHARMPLSLVTGLALICGVDGWLLPFRMHFRVVYLVLLLAIIVWRRRAIVAMLRPVAGGWLDAVDEARRSAALAVLVMFAASTWAWLPTTMYDDLAYHLALPSQLAQLGYYRMDVGSNVWALAPWAADVLQGIAQVLAGAEARGAVDTLWFGISCMLVWQLGRALSLPTAMRWLAVAMFAALPLTMTLLHSMQTEGPTVTAMLALAYLITTRPRPDGRALVVMGVLFGLLIGLKVSNLWFAGPLGLWLLWRSRAAFAWRALPLALLLGAVVAGSSYVYAWVLTGNPVLPLFNDVFQSPWYPVANFHDPRWDTGFRWDLVWNLVFQPGTYMESGSIGPLVLIALGGCFFVALAKPRTRGLALVGAVCLLLPLFMIQYLRYAYPALALLIPAMLCGVPLADAGTRLARGTWAALWTLVTVSLVFAGSAGWQMKSGALGTRLISGKTAVMARYAPIRFVLDNIDKRRGKSARVLILARDMPFAAQMAGRAFVTNWYDPQLSALAGKAREAKNSRGWLTLFEHSGANVLVTREGEADHGLMQAIKARHGRKAFTFKGLDAWQLPAAATVEPRSHDLSAERDMASRVRGWFGIGGTSDIAWTGS